MKDQKWLYLVQNGQLSTFFLIVNAQIRNMVGLCAERKLGKVRLLKEGSVYDVKYQPWGYETNATGAN